MSYIATYLCRLLLHFIDNRYEIMEINKRFDNIPLLVIFKKWCYSFLDIVKCC